MFKSANLIVWFVLLLCPWLVNAQLYTFKNYNHRDGLTLSSILSVEEADDGYLWFGTDGAGLMRFDGHDFDYLEDIQGRTNRHVNHLSFKDENLFFTTLYRSNFRLNYDLIEELDFVSQYGSNHAIIPRENDFILVQDGGLFIYRDSIVVNERRTFPYNEQTNFYGSFERGRIQFIFTSKGNYVVEDDRIENLHDWLRTSEEVTDSLVSVANFEDSLVFTNISLKKELIVLMDEYRPKFNIENKIFGLNLEKGEQIVASDSRFDISVFVSNKGKVYLRNEGDGTYNELFNNSDQELIAPTDVLIDRNHDIWVTSVNSGIFRVSLEPFTQINFSEIYEDPLIMFIGRTKDLDAVISMGRGVTYVGNRRSNKGFVEYQGLRVYSMASFQGVDYLATNEGLKEVEDTKIMPSQRVIGIDAPLTLVFGGKRYFWFGKEGIGLFRYNPENDSVVHYDQAPAYFYTATFNADSTILYFGSNNGVYHFDLKSEAFGKLNSIVNKKNLGSYVGNSTIDNYGTVWFSMDEGLLGVTREGEINAVTAQRFLPSTLIYTLDADSYGNLIVGTNKGVTVLEVDTKGNALSSNTFNSENGFNGYETHMRSSFQTEGGNIFVGTLEGLFMIRPELLQKKIKPISPKITTINNEKYFWFDRDRSRRKIDVDDNNISFDFKSVNAKTSFIKYSYTLSKDGAAEEWSEWKSGQSALFTNLEPGSYVFKVRSTIDGTLYSDASTFSFEVFQPFYRTKWFIIFIIGFVVIANFVVLERTKSFNKKNIILSRDVGTDSKMAASILLFGAFANTAAHLFASRIDDTIEIHDISSILVGVVVFILFGLIAFKKELVRFSNQLLILGFLIILVYNHLLTFLSDIHPFYFSATLLVSFVAPFVFRSLKASIAFGFVLMLASVAVVFYIEEAKYNQYLFLIGMGIAAFLAIFMTYLRNNSLERLIFTSGVVNKGNALVVAFDGKGKISYASENIEELLDIKDTLVGNYISELNQFQPEVKDHKKFSNVDLKEDFQEGKIFVTPLFTKNGEIVYYQWSCKEFSNDVRVILGQDVTDKINLENYYELIVRNADDLIFQTDPKGVITFVNEKCIDVFGRTYDDLIGSSLISVVSEKYKKKVESFYHQNFKERKRTDYIEFPILTPDGNERWLGQNVTTLLKPGADNIVTGFLGLARDITERRKANSIIKEQNKDITASINYARRIQFNLLPRTAAFEKAFEEHFILYKPKDIVSGDFYWLDSIGDKTIIVCSDCTGHGVPGSFMTLLGINILNQIILEGKETDPGEIFNKLDERLIQVLPRDGQNQIKDGMEAVVCVFDNKSETMSYAAAGGRFVIRDEENNDISVVKGQTKHIGDEPTEPNFKYKTESITLTNKQTLYLFSDGYPDQFGGEKNKKLSIKMFLALLDALTPQDLHEQNEMFREHLSDWIGEEPQTDDITVIGVRGLRARKK